MKQIPRFIPTLTISEIIQAVFINVKNRKRFDFLKLFREEFAKYIGIKYAIAVPSARIGLAAILSALKIPKGKEVIIPSLTHQAIPYIFCDFGLKPRFVDIDPDRYCIDVDKIEEAINETTALIFPVHLYGRACNMKVIMELAKKHGLFVIEDCAQSCGGGCLEQKLGSFGVASIFSFHPHKNISVLGSGMVTTNSREIFEDITQSVKQYERMCWKGVVKRLLYSAGLRFATLAGIWRNITVLILKIFNRQGVDIVEFMTNEVPEKDREKAKKTKWYLPQSYHGVIGLKQLERLDSLNKKRINNGNILWEGLKKIEGINLVSQAQSDENIYTTFVVRVNNRGRFRRRMLRLGVDTHSGNMFAGSAIPGFEKRGESKVADDIVNRMVHLPVYPDLSRKDLKKIIESAEKAINNE
jgi:dTDP-4-amino-4,6-dideoxygalactose transaminase